MILFPIWFYLWFYFHFVQVSTVLVHHSLLLKRYELQYYLIQKWGSLVRITSLLLRNQWYFKIFFLFVAYLYNTVRNTNNKGWQERFQENLKKNRWVILFLYFWRLTWLLVSNLKFPKCFLSSPSTSSSSPVTPLKLILKSLVSLSSSPQSESVPLSQSQSGQVLPLAERVVTSPCRAPGESEENPTGLRGLLVTGGHLRLSSRCWDSAATVLIASQGP